MLRELLLNMLYPNRCVGCDELLEYPKPLCAGCRGELEPLKVSNYPTLCPRCHRPEGCLCDVLERMSAVMAPFVYTGRAKDMVIYAKSHNNLALFTYMASKMTEVLKIETEVKFYGVSYVPASKASLKLRGFNQTHSLAQEVSRMLDLPLIAPPIIREDDSRPQHLLTAPERRNNAQGSYFLTPSESPLRGNILLIDDIVTTGATLEQCGALLLQAGAERVYGLCFATALLRGE